MNNSTHRVVEPRISAFIFFIFILSALTPLMAQIASWRSTTNQSRWVDKGTLTSTSWSASSTKYLELFPDSQYQVIEGFGGCFCEKGWDALSALSAEGRDSVMRALFDTSGCNFTVCRMPIGANDFADDYYSLNDSANDYTMTYFNIARDKNNLIQYMKAAMVYKPNLRLWGSPWTPPQWMKTTKIYSGDGHLTQDTQTLSAYVLYLEKTVAAFQAEGINLTTICAQNEPTQGLRQSYPSCVWSIPEYQNFYRNYLIPRFKADSVKADLMWGTFCVGNFKDWIDSAMHDSVIFNNVPIVGIQQVVSPNGAWSSQAHAAYPAKRVYETETNCCHNNDWAGGKLEFNLLANWLKSFAVVYSQWNMILDETGLSGWDWKQASMVTVNKTTKEVTYNPHFYAVKHFSYAIKPDARLIKWVNTDNLYKSAVGAFRNPNNDLVVIASCTTTTAYPLLIKLGASAISASLPSNSFNTFIIKLPTAAGDALNCQAAPDVSGLRINNNSTLSFALSSGMGTSEIEFSLINLKGATVWSRHLVAEDLQAGGLHTIAMRPKSAGIPSGTYFLGMKMATPSRGIATLVKKVSIVR